MLSFVVPFYNCADTAKETVKQIQNHLSRLSEPFQIITVDDGSRDATPSVLSALQDSHLLLIRHFQNLGKGASVRSGVLAASGDKIIFTDADLAYGLEPVEGFLSALEKYDIAVGCRIRDACFSKRYGKVRAYCGKAFSSAANRILELNIEDTQCGFKAFRADTAKNLFERLEIHGFGFDFEILAKAKAQNFSIKKVPVTLLSNGNNSCVKLLKDGSAMLFELLKLRRSLKTDTQFSHHYKN